MQGTPMVTYQRARGPHVEKSSSPRCFTTKPKKLARQELEKSKQFEIAVPRPLSSAYYYVITTQFKLEIAVPRPLSST